MTGAVARRAVIGVLGGMGPLATVELMRRLIVRTPAQDDQDHIRLVVEHNPQIPSRIKALLEDGVSPLEALLSMVARLTHVGVDAIVSPCNTSHAYFPELQRATAVPLLSMIEAAAGELEEARQVLVLASEPMRQLGLFEQHAVRCCYPSEQEAVQGLIMGVKARGVDRESVEAFASILQRAGGGACDGILVGCTELSLLYEACRDRAFGVKVVDTLDVLVEEMFGLDERMRERPRILQ